MAALGRPSNLSVKNALDPRLTSSFYESPVTSPGQYQPCRVRRGSTGSNGEAVFEDAYEAVPKMTSMDLEQSIEETRIALNLFLNNRFDEAKLRMEPWAKESMYHSLGYSTILYIKAMMTCEQADINTAIESSKMACAVCDSNRRRGLSLTGQVTKHVTKFVRGSNGKSLFTDDEMHAELCYAECLLQRALLTFVQDENLVSFIKGALKIRACYLSYKECQKILQDLAWGSRDARLRAHFESGVKMGMGAFDLMISVLPNRVLKLLEFVGFSGNKELGLYQLTTGAGMEWALRSRLCALVLLTWHLIAVYVLGTGHGDIALCQKLLQPLLRDYPNGALVLYFAGRLCIVTTQIPNGIEYLQQSINAQSEWNQFHHLCYWELMFAHAYLRQWTQCVAYAQELYAKNRWSRASYAYLSGVFLLAQKPWNLTWVEREEMDRYFAAVPGMKQRIAGKSLPMEKFCIYKAERYNRRKTLILAHYELLYLWNGFQIVGPDEELAKPILNEVEKTMEQQEKSGNFDVDDRCLCLLLKAMCLKNLQSPFQAQMHLAEILQYEKKLTDHLYLVPNALLELGILHMEEGRIQQSKECLTRAKEIKGYLLESRLHFRVHSLSDRINLQTPE